jgi:hypothetical protein
MLEKQSRMGIRSFLRSIFGAVPAPPDATRLDGTSEDALALSLSKLSPGKRGWITSAEASILFSSKSAEYAFGETDRAGRRNIETFAAQHVSAITFMPVEGRVYFQRDPT